MMPDLVRRLNSSGRLAVGFTIFLGALMGACALVFNGGMWGG